MNSQGDIAMKLTKKALKQLIKEELEGETYGKPEKTRDEEIWTKATQIVSTTKTSGDLETIARLAEGILDLVDRLPGQPADGAMNEEPEARGWKFKFVDLDKRTQRMAKRLGMAGDEQVFVVDSAPTRTAALKMVYSQLLAKLARQRSKR